MHSMVLRAAVGDFEDAHLYGSLQQSADNTTKDKRYFFLPDIRSFALIALEIVSKMCERKFQNRYVSYDSEQAAMRRNLENMISDTEDDFDDGYRYDPEDTCRMFESVHPSEYLKMPNAKERCKSPDPAIHLGNSRSHENVWEHGRASSPDFIYHNGNIMSDGTYSYSDEEVELPDLTGEGYRPMSPPPPQSSGKKTSREFHKGHDRVSSPEHETDPRRSKLKKPRNPEKSKHPVQSFSPTRCLSPARKERDRPISPDPMHDTKLQELREKADSKKVSRKDSRKLSFSKNQSFGEVKKTSRVVEAFTGSAEKTEKRKDGSWLSKPTSILKSITSNDTTVSAFKAKSLDDDNEPLDVIEEEDIENQPDNVRKKAKAQRKQQEKEVWDIISDQYYSQMNKRLSGKLKKTVSGESRSSLWSFISTGEENEGEEDIDSIIECLPGMAQPEDYWKNRISVNDIISAREQTQNNRKLREEFTYEDERSRFELIDYYEVLKQKGIKIDHLTKQQRMMLETLNEARLAEIIRRDNEAKTSDVNEVKANDDENAIKSDEMYENYMNPGSTPCTKPMTEKQKIKVVSFRKNQEAQKQQSTSEPAQPTAREDPDPRTARARSAPLKRPRTPMQKADINPAFADAKSQVRRNRARTALKRAITNRHATSAYMQRSDRDAQTMREKPNLAVKYANIKRLQAVDNNSGTEYSSNDEKHANGGDKNYPISTPEHFTITSQRKTLGRTPSFGSSNESTCSFASSARKANVSMTSGEFSSLSSQAESDHFETDNQTTDSEKTKKRLHTAKRKLHRATRVDSGFDSGSMSSEFSSDMKGKHSQQYYTPVELSHQNSNFWSKNNQSIKSSSSFSSSSYPVPVDCLPEEILPPDTMASQRLKSVARLDAFMISQNSYRENEIEHVDQMEENRICSPPPRIIEVHSSGENTPTPRVIEVTSARVETSLNLNKSHLSGQNVPNMGVSDTNDIKHNPASQVEEANEDPMQTSGLVDVTMPRSSKVASKRYRELVRQGVPMRASIIDSSPPRASPEAWELNENEQHLTRPGTAESEDPVDDQMLYENLEANGFFKGHSPKLPRSPKTRMKTRGQTQPSNQSKNSKKKNMKKLPLDEIIREIPHNQSQHTQRKENSYFNASAEDAYLNQPTSEDSETCSVKTSKSSNSVHNGLKPKVMVDAELVIDRIFSQAHENDSGQLDVEVEAALGLDRDTFKSLTEFTEPIKKDVYFNLNEETVPLPEGTSQKHIDDCIELAMKLHVVDVKDLLPPHEETFKVLRHKLQSVGQLGTVGIQLLDVIHTCWLSEMPPPTGDLVEELTDPVTETEV
ncbi:hypothetical protein CHS0354_007746 [Potamilus streckersoni]|uniref:Uncharacterized protein n=1 Tax=Potamilus streckersoni TaxID=2493646 RepID=A0AAE0RRZ1_9BIVA|nr:hypothetical protein CHS0354_007746 [Potamilus streckersoni]